MVLCNSPITKIFSCSLRVQHEPDTIESEETEPASCCQYDATTHPYMATLIVFLAFLIDALLLTVVGM